MKPNIHHVHKCDLVGEIPVFSIIFNDLLLHILGRVCQVTWCLVNVLYALQTSKLYFSGNVMVYIVYAMILHVLKLCDN